MKVLVGLGNPGPKYSFSRHNLGFMVVDFMASIAGVAWKQRSSALVAELILANDDKLILFKPQKFMNLSGQVISEFVRFFKIPLEDLVLVYDDIDMEFAKVKIRRGGGSGGHNGVKDTVRALGTEDFTRVKVGAGRPAHIQQQVSDWVLEAMKENELKLFRDEALPLVFERLEDLWGRGVLTKLR